METENLSSASASSDHEESFEPDIRNANHSGDNGVGRDRVLLTSRVIKKHVTIQEDSASKTRAFSDVEDAVQNLETNFAAGLDELRKSLSAFSSDRKVFELHIKSLEESLRKSTQEKDNYREIVNKMRDEVEALAIKLEAVETLNEGLQGKNEMLLSDHEDHMRTIADHHRTNRVAKKAFVKWKGKLKKGELSNDQIEKLIAENANLKMELLHYQESTKNAFLRSANVLNTEALSLFQDTTSRFINIPPAVNYFTKGPGSNIDTSSESIRSSISTLGELIGKVNERSKIKENTQDYSRKSHHNVEGKYDRHQEKSHSDNELYSVSKRGINEFIPDPIRRETRQIMKQLETNRKPVSNFVKKDNLCNANKHLHICHCSQYPDKNNCTFCYATQNFRFDNISIPKQPQSKPKGSMKFGYNIRSSDAVEQNGSNRAHAYRNKSEPLRFQVEKSRVIYKPSGSTVVVEKHA